MRSEARVSASITDELAAPAPRSRSWAVPAGRLILLTHRYLGIAIGVLMALWCLSGIVMIYVPYPRLAEAERLAALPPIKWVHCCVLNDPAMPDATAEVSEFQLEMLGNVPVLRLTLANSRFQMFDLTTGRPLAALEQQDAREAAAPFGSARSLSLKEASQTLLEHDQWTVGAYRPDRPLHRIAFNDPAGTEIYVSSRTGKVVQKTTASQRFWNWLGAVPHWLYPSVLRQHVEVWAQVVIWTSLIGTFLAATGIYIGIRQLTRRRRDGALVSPYRGFMYWHHVLGLVFGVLALTWVLSGLLSMNPWGLLEINGVREDRAQLTGELPTVAGVLKVIETIPRNSPNGVVSIRSAPLDGALYAVSTSADGERQRFSVDGAQAPLTPAQIERAARRLVGEGNAPTWAMMTEEDAYHYSLRRESAPLPAIRVASQADPDTFYYLDALTAQLINKADAGGRGFRWWHSGLHRLDFTPALRSDAARTLLMLPLLLGVTAMCALGAWLGIKRLTK
jgi:uncharacterized iron-regulated membrane protein